MRSLVEAGGVEPTVRKNDHKRLSERRLCFRLRSAGAHSPAPLGAISMRVLGNLRELVPEPACWCDTLIRPRRLRPAGCWLTYAARASSFLSAVMPLPPFYGPAATPARSSCHQFPRRNHVAPGLSISRGSPFRSPAGLPAWRCPRACRRASCP